MQIKKKDCYTRVCVCVCGRKEDETTSCYRIYQNFMQDSNIKVKTCVIGVHGFSIDTLTYGAWV